MGGGLSCFSHSAISSVNISAESSLSVLMAARVLCSTHRNVPMVFHLARNGNRHLQTSAMCSLVSGLVGGWFGVALMWTAEEWFRGEVGGSWLGVMLVVVVKGEDAGV